MRTLLAVLLGMSAAAVLPAQEVGKGLVIVLIGPPGSGKTTQAEFLKKKYSIPVITADRTTTDATLLRDIQKAGTAKGFVLDGYPATREQADHLGKIVKQLNLPSPVVVSLEVPDAVVRERLKGKEKPEVLDQRLSSYHQEMDLIRQYYPQADIWTVIGTRPVKEVSETIEMLISDRK
jgi:adenylate kinase